MWINDYYHFFIICEMKINTLKLLVSQPKTSRKTKQDEDIFLLNGLFKDRVKASL